MNRPRIAAACAAGLLAVAAAAGAVRASGYDIAGRCAVVPLRFVFAGVEKAPRAPDGNPPAFICDGTSYVPTRFMAAALGQKVSWDGATDTITIRPAAGSGACPLEVDITQADGTVWGTVTASYAGVSQTLSAASQSLPLPCGTSVVLTERPVDPADWPFAGWSLQTPTGATGSANTTLELRLDGPTTVGANYEPATGG
jgi:hypothetical protein